MTICKTFRVAFVGLTGVLFLAAAGAALSGSLAACASISDTSPLPNGDASDLDAGFVPVTDNTSSAPPSTTIDAGPPPPSGRVRLANLLQDTGPVDLCVKADSASAPWEGQRIANPGGLGFGEVSSHVFLPVATSQGQRYQFRIVPLGGSCESEAGALVSIPGGTTTTLRQGGGLTIAVTGIVGSGDPQTGPKGTVVSDVLAPPAAVAMLRAIHGVSDMTAFDVLINGEMAIQGVKYGSGLGFPYASPNGFASLAGGIPEGATLTLKAGTTARSFKVPARVRRGVAMTLFASGRVNGSPQIAVSLCADRSPPDGETLATCTKLPETE